MYVKLFASILTSTLWALDDATRITWITLLALSDRDGFVRASPSGLARLANIDPALCAKSIAILSEPDPDSATQDFDGRRIEVVPGGYVILNYNKYRDLKDTEARREQVRQAVSRHRQKKSGVITGNPKKAHAEEEVNAEAVTTIPRKARVKETWLTPFADAWRSQYGGELAYGQASKALAPLRKAHGDAAALERWTAYLAATDAAYASPTRFAATFGRWDGTPQKRIDKITVGRENLARWMESDDATIDDGSDILTGGF